MIQQKQPKMLDSSNRTVLKMCIGPASYAHRFATICKHVIAICVANDKCSEMCKYAQRKCFASVTPPHHHHHLYAV